MKTAKQAVYDPPLGDPWQAGTDVPDVLVKIEGLRHEPGAGEFTFSLEGVKHRNVNWSLVREGLGFEGDMPDDLIDDLSAVIWRHDLIRILADRIKPA